MSTLKRLDLRLDLRGLPGGPVEKGPTTKASWGEDNLVARRAALVVPPTNDETSLPSLLVSG